MLDVVQLRFKALRPRTRTVGEDRFVIEMDNLSRTGKIVIQARVELDNVPIFDHIKGMEITADQNLVAEIKKVITQALV